MTVTTAELLYSRESFARQGDGVDAKFYAVDRFVPHLDNVAPPLSRS